MVMENGMLTSFKLVSSFMQPVSTCSRWSRIFPNKAKLTKNKFLPKLCIYIAREVWAAIREFVVMIHVLFDI